MCTIDWQLVIEAIGSLGSLLALFFIFKTLRLQNSTLKEQQRLTDLEHKRYIESNSPNIVIHEIKDCSTDNLECISIVLEINDNYFLNFRYEENLSYIGYSVEKEDDIINRNNTYNIGERIKFKISRKKDVINSADGIIEGYGITLYYENKFGHSFNQVIYYSGKKYIYISPAFRQRLT